MSLRLWPLLLFTALPLLIAQETPRPWPDVPFRPLTVQLVATLPPDVQPVWQNYLAESDRRRALDQQTLAVEVKAAGVTQLKPPAKRKTAGPRLREPAAWYSSDEALTLADIIISFQTPAGGWSKATDYSRARQSGEHFAVEASYLGTFDNNATIPELRYLARVTTAASDANTANRHREAFLRGMSYVFASQYPNGGFPQVYPLIGSYHDAITYNDGAMIAVLQLLRDIAGGGQEFAFVSPELRREASQRLAQGVACILASQLVVDGRRAAWGQQHDQINLAPCAARNFEPVAHSAAESAGIVTFLMSLPKPSAEVVAAVDAAVSWFGRAALRDVAWQKSDAPGGHSLVAAPDAEPLWARLYEIGTDKPIFGDRDKSVYYSVEKVSPERIRGYAWFVDAPARVIAQHAKWRVKVAGR